MSFKAAIGQLVAVNVIMGMSLLKTRKSSLDLEANVMENGVLDTPPFDIAFKSIFKITPQLSNIVVNPILIEPSHIESHQVAQYIKD